MYIVCSQIQAWNYLFQTSNFQTYGLATVETQFSFQWVGPNMRGKTHAHKIIRWLEFSAKLLHHVVAGSSKCHVSCLQKTFHEVFPPLHGSSWGAAELSTIILGMAFYFQFYCDLYFNWSQQLASWLMILIFADRCTVYIAYLHRTEMEDIYTYMIPILLEKRNCFVDEVSWVCNTKSRSNASLTKHIPRREERNKKWWLILFVDFFSISCIIT